MKKHFTKLVFTFLTIVLLGQAGISQTYIWGGPGDPNSEFAGGLNDWTVNAVSPNANALWVWEADGKADKGAYSGESSIIESPSVSNGAMVFDSDFYDNAGIKGNFEKGIAPAPQKGELISPEFSCEGHESVWIQFNQSFRNFRSTTTYAVSIDGGATWTEGHPFNTDVPVNEAIDPASVKLIDISDIAAGQANVKIKFIFKADYYFWIIDDVYIIDTPPADPQIAGTWYPSMHYEIPHFMANQDSMLFVMDIVNRGGKGTAVNNGMAKVTLFNTDLELVYFSDSSTYSVENDTARVYFKSFKLPDNPDTGLYLVYYKLIGNDFGSTEKKINRQYFRITAPRFESTEGGDSIFTARMRNSDDHLESYWGNDEERYNITYYKLPDWVENNNIQVKAYSVSFAILLNDNTIPKITYNTDVHFLKLRDTIDRYLSNFNLIDGYLEDDTQTEYIGYAGDPFKNIINGSTQTTYLYDLDDEQGIDLEPNGQYFVSMHWPGKDTYYQIVDNHNIGGSKRYYYRWDNRAITGDTMYAQYVSFIYDPTDKRYYIPTGTGNITLIYAIDLNMKVNVSTSTEDELLPENTIILRQNPVRDELGVNINFNNTKDKVSMIISDLKGSLLDMRTVSNLKSDIQRFNVGNYPSGTYIFTIFTKDKLLSKKFVVQH